MDVFCCFSVSIEFDLWRVEFVIIWIFVLVLIYFLGLRNIFEGEFKKGKL